MEPAIKYKTAIYCRLSKEDERGRESSSIETQKKMLTGFAKEHGFEVYDTYIDDGYSGTNFDRPGINRLKQDIIDKKIDLVLIKDLSRLGRNYLEVGKLIDEFFPQHRIRCITVCDSYDSDSDDNDFIPFKNALNELYSKDISRKIKSALKTKMKNGEFIGSFAPYGYKKSPQNKNKLIIDPEAAMFVKKIFKMAADGERPIDIAKYFNDSKISSPAVYKCSVNKKLDIDNYSKYKKWTSAGIQKILKNSVYIGQMVQSKTEKYSCTSKLIFQNDKNDWIIVDNTHEPIIDKDTFYTVQKRIVARRNKPNSNFQNIFSGIAKCADCGSHMSTTGTRKKGSTYNLVCGKYKLRGSRECTNHFIDYDELSNIVLETLNKYLRVNDVQKQQVLKELEHQNNDSSDADRKKQIKFLYDRLSDITHTSQRLYEDHLFKRIPDDIYEAMFDSYCCETEQIKCEIKCLKEQKEMNLYEKYSNFFELLSGEKQITELNADIVNKLVDRIIIYQGEWQVIDGRKQKSQMIEIYLKFIGKV